MNEVKIRDRQLTDLDQCVEALAVVHDVDGYPLNWPVDPHGWLCSPGILQAWIAETASAIVGHVVLQLVAPSITANGSPTPPTAEVSRLFVVPAARRQAVASGLLHHAHQWAADHGFGLTLEVTDDQRSAAIALYERNGWRHTHTTKANWTAPDGKPVSLRHYTRSQDPGETA
ncbi:GNAT family N-acetyltransferase [Micromonospora sp. NBC_00898]|uniref:GNAT family N-acetyltransferase n=1 Tax=Micromonospora sp. NBC_00898 TaxID=2975981 RepID=UPI00386A88CE|nr:GNAT family N-acetyltransferase [Micromonospora sp. NBC_00898]